MSWGNVTAYAEHEDGEPVDDTLAARLELRAALARIVAEHPELTSEAARERAAAWVAEQEQDGHEVNRVEHE